MKIIKNKNNLEIKTLKEVSTHITSGRRLPKELDYSNEVSDFLYFKVGDIKDIPNYNKLSFIDENTYNLLKKYEINENDLILSNIGTVGKVVFFEKSIFNYDKKMILTENCLKITTDKSIIMDKYLMFSLRSKKVQKEIDENTIKTAMPKLSINRAVNIKLNVPVLEMQKKITQLLDYENNRIGVIKNLLEKIEIRNQYYADKLTSGKIKLNNSVSIINDKFENIVNEHKKSKVMAGNSLKEGLYPFFNCSKKQTLFSNEYLIDDSVLLLSTGGAAAVNYYNGKLSYSTDVWCITSKYTKYLYYFYNANINKIEQCFQGGGLKHLSKKDFKNIEITIPNNDKDIQEIVNYLDKLNDEKEKVERLLKLEEQRFEWLSDKLLSGEYIIED